MTAIATFDRRLLAAVDVKGYGGSDDRRQDRIQRALAHLLDTAAARAGLDRASWDRQPAGDGELALLPLTEPEPRVVDDFTRHLAHELRRHNEDVLPERQMRIRMAIHYGSASAAAMGYSGQGVVVVSRLLDSAPLRAALMYAEVAVLLSSTVFEDVVANGHTTIPPAQCTAVDVSVKELLTRAYLFVPGGQQGGHAPAAPRLTDSDAGAAGSVSAPAPTRLSTEDVPTDPAADTGQAPEDERATYLTHTEMHAPVTIDFAVFGVNRGPRP